MLPTSPACTLRRFQSTPPRRGDGGCKSRTERPAVSIHAPAKGRLPDGRLSAQTHVSIHAPAKGRLQPMASEDCDLAGFNPRPREGATAAARRRVHRRPRFQSTPPRRGDGARSMASGGAVEVSIHAPAKGRLDRAAHDLRSTGFQSTPPRRGDEYCTDPCFRVERGFNPRPREGATSGCDEIRSSQGFNPRPREGATRPTRRRYARDLVSIHAPAKGRPSNGVTPLRRLRFQSTPPRRGDSTDYTASTWRAVSIHAPAKGRLGDARRSSAMASVSIHAPAKGRLRFCGLFASRRRVSIHAPAKGRRTSSRSTM